MRGISKIFKWYNEAAEMSSGAFYEETERLGKDMTDDLKTEEDMASERAKFDHDNTVVATLHVKEQSLELRLKRNSNVTVWQDGVLVVEMASSTMGDLLSIKRALFAGMDRDVTQEMYFNARAQAENYRRLTGI